MFICYQYNKDGQIVVRSETPTPPRIANQLIFEFNEVYEQVLNTYSVLDPSTGLPIIKKGLIWQERFNLMLHIIDVKKKRIYNKDREEVRYFDVAKMLHRASQHYERKV